MEATSLTSFLDMGGYAAYIWPVYGLAAGVMIALLVKSIIKLRQNEAELAHLKSMQKHKNEAVQISVSGEKEAKEEEAGPCEDVPRNHP